MSSGLQQKLKNKLIHWDIETSFIHTMTHYIGRKVSMNHSQVTMDKRIICISYIVEGWKKPKTLYWDDKQDDREMLIKFSKILNKYPVSVGQNLDAFDIKTFKGRLWAAGVPPITNLLSLDTLKMSRQNMKLTSHTLDYKAKVIGSVGKFPMSMSDWVGVDRLGLINKFYATHYRLPNRRELTMIDLGIKKAQEKMGHYNREDVLECQKVFWSLVPYCDKLAVRLGRLVAPETDGCTNCGEELLTRNGTRVGRSGAHQRWICYECGHDWPDTRLKRTTDALIKKGKIKLRRDSK